MEIFILKGHSNIKCVEWELKKKESTLCENLHHIDAFSNLDSRSL